MNYFNDNISDWNVSNVTNMSVMFADAKGFNQPLNNWNVSKVTNMEEMFDGAENFNQDITMWNVGNVSEGIDDFKKYVSRYKELNDIETI